MEVFFVFFFFKKRVAILQERSCTLLFPRSSSFVMPCAAWDLKRKGRRYMAFQTLDVFEEEEKTNRATWWCWWLGYYFFYCISFFFFFCSVSARSPSSLSLHAISFIFSSLSSCSCHPSWQVCRLLAWSGRENRTAPPRSPGGRNNKGRLKQGWHPSCKMTSLMKLVRWYWQWCISLLQTVFMASLDDRGWEIWSGMVRLGWMGND